MTLPIWVVLAMSRDVEGNEITMPVGIALSEGEAQQWKNEFISHDIPAQTFCILAGNRGPRISTIFIPTGDGTKVLKCHRPEPLWPENWPEAWIKQS